MFNKDFLKTITILYVEDDEITRIKLAKILKRIFKDVLLASNGLEGYILFQEQQLANNTIDLILSDINMPKMNGIEMLEQIRSLDNDIPMIYTTARTESEYLIRAIELGVHHYVIKPIDTEDIISRVQKVCEKKYYQNLLQSKNRELEQYLNIIDSVAVVIKINEDGIITFSNSLFLETLKVSQTQLLQKQFNTLVHKDTSSSFLEEMWVSLKQGETWHGDIKYEDTNEEVFFVNSTLFQVTHDTENEYINIGFLSTDEVNEKREFHKKIIKNMNKNSVNTIESKNKINQLSNQLDATKNGNIHQQEVIKNLKEKNNTLLSQVDHFCKELINKDDTHHKTIERTKLNLEKITNSYKKAMQTIALQKESLDFMSEDEKKKKDESIRQEEIINEQRAIIQGLRDTLKNISKDDEKKKDSSILDKLLG